MEASAGLLTIDATVSNAGAAHEDGCICWREEPHCGCVLVSLGCVACHDDSSPLTDSAAPNSRTVNAVPSSPTDAGGIPIRKPTTSTANATITGIAFVDASVTGQGGKAKLPAGTEVYPSGSTISGTVGCPTTRYQTDGLIVAVIDYDGRPTSASLTLTEHLASGSTIDRAPYYIDLNPGRTLQFLGPVFDNGSLDMVFEYDYSLGAGQKRMGSFTLSRNCPASRRLEVCL